MEDCQYFRHLPRDQKYQAIAACHHDRQNSIATTEGMGTGEIFLLMALALAMSLAAMKLSR